MVGSFGGLNVPLRFFGEFERCFLRVPGVFLNLLAPPGALWSRDESVCMTLGLDPFEPAGASWGSLVCFIYVCRYNGSSKSFFLGCVDFFPAQALWFLIIAHYSIDSIL